MTQTIKEIKEQLALVYTFRRIRSTFSTSRFPKRCTKALDSRKKQLIKQQTLEENYKKMTQYENNIFKS